jgi:hypothetical protein
MRAVTFRSLHPALIPAKRPWRAALLGCCVLAAATACSSSVPAAAPAAAAGSSSSSAATASRDAYTTCLREHGAAVPTAKASPGTAKKAAHATVSATARADCASLKPKGTGNHQNAAVEAFDTCMTAHGETVPAAQPDPAASPKPTGVDRYLHGLNPDNVKVAAALKACESKLPSAIVSG